MLLVPTFVAQSGIHGLGLFAAAPIAEGATIWSYHPMLDLTIPEADLESIPEVAREFIKIYGYRTLTDRTSYVLNTDDGRFMNHHPEANTVTIGDFVYAKKDIAKGDEITTDYTEFMVTDTMPFARRDEGEPLAQR